MATDSTIVASIVIPVKNGGEKFIDVCESVAAQQLDGKFEVICVDSGSTDGSQGIARDHGFCVIEIPSAEFGHGKTRNFGASQGSGEYIVFLTHDAIPADNNWLQLLIKPLKEDPAVVGAFSRHIAHKGADPFIKWELDQHFAGLANYPICHITDREDYESNLSLQQVYHFFSDNASCLRRNVWEIYPLPEVQFAEDQIWAKTIIEVGYKKAFAVESVVKHSHSFGPWETLQRSFDESRAFHKLFGYKLCDSWKSVAKSSIYLCKRDLGNAFNNGWWRTHPLKSFSKIFEAFTRPFGHYLGWQKRLPKVIEQYLSRDEWIRNL